MARDRRRFLQSAGALGGAALLLPRTLVAQAQAPTAAALDQDYYAGRVREWFYLYSPGAEHQGQLRLQRVELDSTDQQVTAFSLVLRSRWGQPVMPAGYYQVSGEPFDLYIQHSHTSRKKHFYLAQFALLQA